MTYNFFADTRDKIDILDFIFKNTDLLIYDHYSPFGQEINVYKNTDQISSKFDLNKGGQFAFTFQLWSQRFKGDIIYKRIELDPKKCNGYTYRYSTEGWGLIQLYFGGLQNNILHHSHIGHFNEKGALKWESTNKLNGKVINWDWKEIEKTSRQIKFQIQQKLSIRKIGSYAVLSGADKLENQGIELR